MTEYARRIDNYQDTKQEKEVRERTTKKLKQNGSLPHGPSLPTFRLQCLDQNLCLRFDIDQICAGLFGSYCVLRHRREAAGLTGAKKGVHSERPSLLAEQPQAGIETLDHLLGLANAVEVEAVARYAQLAELMDQRSESETAEVFREMCAIEKKHVDMVAHRAMSLGRQLPPPAEFSWRLPPELGASWNEIRHSSLLTPYRALAIAVTNEERAFALYSYIAAAADDPEVAREAETLAREELAHAAELRVLRRRAYHSAFPAERPASVETLADFRALDGRLARRAADTLEAIAASLKEVGDGDSAELVSALARREEAAAAATAAAPGDTGYRPKSSRPGALLQEALHPLEAASEIYEHLVDQAPSEDLLRAAQGALHRVVEGISTLGRRREEIDARDGGPL